MVSEYQCNTICIEERNISDSVVVDLVLRNFRAGKSIYHIIGATTNRLKQTLVDVCDTSQYNEKIKISFTVCSDFNYMKKVNFKIEEEGITINKFSVRILKCAKNITISDIRNEKQIVLKKSQKYVENNINVQHGGTFTNILIINKSDEIVHSSEYYLSDCIEINYHNYPKGIYTLKYSSGDIIQDISIIVN